MGVVRNNNWGSTSRLQMSLTIPLSIVLELQTEYRHLLFVSSARPGY